MKYKVVNPEHACLINIWIDNIFHICILLLLSKIRILVESSKKIYHPKNLIIWGKFPKLFF
jgi:hypothetical protein